jgi:hypothetical protein
VKEPGMPIGYLRERRYSATPAMVLHHHNTQHLLLGSKIKHEE